MNDPLVDVAGLTVSFRTRHGVVDAVRGISFDVRPGECVAIVGESGSGKSVTARTLLGLAGPGADVRAGRLTVAGQDTAGFGERQWRRLRGRTAGLVLQDALASLDPLRTVGGEIGEVLATHGTVPAHRRAARTVELLDSVHVPEPAVRARQFPHQLSGGLRQRALIASAIAAGPPLLIADEPTTALDVTVQAQVLRLLAERRRAGSTLLLVSHDLAVVASIADRILVMRDGLIVERGSTVDVLADPVHPYTRMLLAAVPSASTRGMRLATAPPPTGGPVPGGSAPGGLHARDRLPARRVDTSIAVLTARGVGKTYPNPGGGVRHAVDDVSFRIGQGETLGVVGESGSGKTTLARIVLGFVEPDRGTVELSGGAWSGITERRRRSRRRAVQVISQDPLGSFDPRYPVHRLVAEGLDPAEVPRRARRGRVLDLLHRVGLTADVLDRYPRQLSGGQRQRVAIARALGPRPRLLVCDEPVSALDVSIQAQVLDLLADIQAADGTSMLFISHDLGVVHHISDRVLVMRDGRVVEQGRVVDVFRAPRDDYTRALLAALPALTRILPGV